jgi:Raf kinase inhibitor-like YbhB/YbcL family protein
LIGFDVIGAPKGTYVFNVDISYWDNNLGWQSYDTTHKLYIEVKSQGKPIAGTAMRLTSDKFTYGGKIPAKYSCASENKIPPLKWDNVPSGTQSFVLVMFDDDTAFTHWIVKNIPSGVRDVAEGVPPPGVQLTNDAGNPSYLGPCPAGSETHRYYFKLYAIDTPTLTSITKSSLYAEVESHKIKEADLMGKYH